MDAASFGSNDFRRTVPRFAGNAAEVNQGMVAAVQAVAAELEAPPPQVALAWLSVRGRKLGLPVVPIPGTRTAHRIDENPGALRLNFTAAHLEKLDATADAVVGSRSADPAGCPRAGNNRGREQQRRG